MSFVTRCPDCGTAFRVVPDQLKISEGWVRCGHCQAVFDATLDLQLWTGETAPGTDSAEPSALAPQPTPSPPTPEPVWPDPDTPPIETPATPYLPDTQDLGPVPDPDLNPPDPAIAPRDASDATQSPPWEAHSPELEIQPEPAPRPNQELRLESEPQSGSESEPQSEPSFVRQARRRAFWRRPAVRAGLLVGSLGLALALAAQWALQHRDQIVATRPDWRPAMQSACAVLGCELKPWRDVRAVQLEDAGLRRLAPGRYALELVLWNQGLAEVATPALELSLTDSADRVWLRKVFGPADLADLPPTIAAQGRLPVRLELAVEGGATSDAAVSGYRVLFFYP